MAGIPSRILDELRGDTPGLWTLPLVPLGWLAEAVTRRRNARFDRGLGVRPVPIPVVSVGNLTVGGTTKTPTVSWLVRRLGEEFAVGVASRGYGGGGIEVFRGGEAERGRVGDEPLLLSRRHPDVWVAVNPDRAAAVAALARKGVECAVADDAFQHRRMSRVFDLVLVDVTSPWGNGRVLPAGSLREPWSGLSRADAVVLTRCDEVDTGTVEEIRERVAGAMGAVGGEGATGSASIYTSRLRLARWSCHRFDPRFDPRFGREQGGRSEESCPDPTGPVFLMTAVGRPSSVERTVRESGLKVVGTDHYPDHHRWTAAEVERVVAAAGRTGAAGIVCTEKDIYNLPSEFRSELPFWVPVVEVEIESGSRLLDAVAGRIRAARSAGKRPGPG